MPAEVVRTVKPNWRDGSRLFCYFSDPCIAHQTWGCSLHTGLASLWGSQQFPQPMIFDDFKFTSATMLHHHRNLMMTLEHGLINTWWLPFFSALLMFLNQQWTFMYTILVVLKDDRKRDSLVLIYYRYQMSVTQEWSRICGFYFIFGFVYGWGCSLFLLLPASVPFIYWINNFCLRVTFRVVCVTLSTLLFKPIRESL